MSSRSTRKTKSSPVRKSRSPTRKSPVKKSPARKPARKSPARKSPRKSPTRSRSPTRTSTRRLSTSRSLSQPPLNLSTYKGGSDMFEQLPDSSIERIFNNLSPENRLIFANASPHAQQIYKRLYY